MRIKGGNGENEAHGKTVYYFWKRIYYYSYFSSNFVH